MQLVSMVPKKIVRILTICVVPLRHNGINVNFGLKISFRTRYFYFILITQLSALNFITNDKIVSDKSLCSYRASTEHHVISSDKRSDTCLIIK
jgi:hypothetical protein